MSVPDETWKTLIRDNHRSSRTDTGLTLVRTKLDFYVAEMETLRELDLPRRT